MKFISFKLIYFALNLSPKTFSKMHVIIFFLKVWNKTETVSLLAFYRRQFWSILLFFPLSENFLNFGCYFGWCVFELFLTPSHCIFHISIPNRITINVSFSTPRNNQPHTEPLNGPFNCCENVYVILSEIMKENRKANNKSSACNRHTFLFAHWSRRKQSRQSSGTIQPEWNCMELECLRKIFHRFRYLTESIQFTINKRRNGSI